jgi:ABC-type transport system involved in multi-copper enzyme maturation permease subunit
MSQVALLRYNFRIMMLNNRWLVAFPLIVSQLTVYWLIITRPHLSPDLPALSVELITPLLGAFLGAHLLSAEYRSRVGALLASRPVNIGRIVVLRLLVMLVLVWGLGYISLLAYTYGMEPFDMTRPILASIPSTLFLTMMALTFATLFRHSLAGFGVAAVYWAMDLIPGPPLQPYLSLKSLTSYYTVMSSPPDQTFLMNWWIAKWVLLAGALLLYMVHARLVFTLGSPQTAGLRRKTLLGAVALMIVYLASGALMRVTYGYANRGRLLPNDIGWFRHQFAPYGPIPVAALFGSDFTKFLGEMNNPWRVPEGNDADVIGDSVKHRHDLADLVNRDSKSMWAPSAADALARLEARRQTDVDKAVAFYRIVPDRYPNSPYVDFSLRQAARLYIDAGRPAQAEATYAELMKRTPESVYRSEALRYLVQAAESSGRSDDAVRWATQWSVIAPIEDRFDAWIALARLRKAHGDTAGAREAATATLKAVKAFRDALAAETVSLLPFQKKTRERAATIAEQQAHAIL